MIDILATTPDKRSRHLEGTIINHGKHYHGNITDVTDITKEASLSVTDTASNVQLIEYFFKVLLERLVSLWVN